jgi:hypothetical protein
LLPPSFLPSLHSIMDIFPRCMRKEKCPVLWDSTGQWEGKEGNFYKVFEEIRQRNKFDWLRVERSQLKVSWWVLIGTGFSLNLLFILGFSLFT